MSSSVIPSSTPRTARAHGDPGVAQPHRRALVLHVLRRAPGDRAERAVDRADHVGDGDLVGRLGERVAALGPTVAGDDPGAPQLEQDVLEELLRDPLRVGQPSRR